MQRIRQWMDENPDGANELRRQNRSYVFFHEVKLSDKDEAVGAQGVPLTPGRSIDRTRRIPSWRARQPIRQSRSIVMGRTNPPL